MNGPSGPLVHGGQKHPHRPHSFVRCHTYLCIHACTHALPSHRWRCMRPGYSRRDFLWREMEEERQGTEGREKRERSAGALPPCHDLLRVSSLTIRVQIRRWVSSIRLSMTQEGETRPKGVPLLPPPGVPPFPPPSAEGMGNSIGTQPVGAHLAWPPGKQSRQSGARADPGPRRCTPPGLYRAPQPLASHPPWFSPCPLPFGVLRLIVR